MPDKGSSLYENVVAAVEGGIAGVYSPLGDQPYKQVLPRVQESVARKLTRQVEDLSEQELKTHITQYIRDNNVKCDLTDSIEILVNHIYHDMAGMSFISREGLMELPGFEELDINSWDDVEIITYGKRQKTEYRFLSPSHAQDIILRILRKTQTPFDIATPRATAELSAGVRITAQRSPLVDDDVAVTASIRKVNMSTVSRDKLVGGALTEEMMTFLELCLLHGASMAISGGTGAGKTTLAGALLTKAATTLRIYTIEEGSREWNFVTRDKDGRVTNSVIHTKTRPNDKDPAQDITQEELVKDALRYDPQIISPGEIRGREAFEVMGVSNTGHTVITTVHANDTLDTPKRIITLAKKAYDMSDNTLYDMCASAFPLLIHMEMGYDGVRRVTEIREVMGYDHGDIKSQLLYEFEVYDNIYEGDVCVRVEGEFKKRNPPSEKFIQRLLKKGAKKSELQIFLAPTKEGENQ